MDPKQGSDADRVAPVIMLTVEGVTSVIEVLRRPVEPGLSAAVAVEGRETGGPSLVATNEISWLRG